MSDNDLIRRGDAVAECQKVADEAKSYGIPQMSMGAHSCRDAIRAIPAVHPVASGPQDATLGRESCMSAQPSPDEHYDDYCIRQFAKLMSEKMAASRAKGRSGWHDPEQCSVEYLRTLLYEHLDKGDPVDVANFCMMLRHYEASTYREYCNCKPSPDVAGLVEALGAEYVLDHPLETSEERMGRHSAVRGIAVRMGCYPQLEAGIIAALAAIKEPKT